MTTFTSDDREEAYKKILEEAPAHIGYEDAVQVPSNRKAPRELTDEEIRALWNPMPDTKVYVRDLLAFARAVLKANK